LVQQLPAQPTVAPQIRVDQAAPSQPEHPASETSLAAVLVSSATCPPNTQAVHAIGTWNDFRQWSPAVQTIQIRAALTTDSGQTWSEFPAPVGPPFSTATQYDPMTAADARTGTLWVGGVWN